MDLDLELSINCSSARSLIRPTSRKSFRRPPSVASAKRRFQEHSAALLIDQRNNIKIPRPALLPSKTSSRTPAPNATTSEILASSLSLAESPMRIATRVSMADPPTASHVITTATELWCRLEKMHRS